MRTLTLILVLLAACGVDAPTTPDAPDVPPSIVNTIDDTAVPAFPNFDLPSCASLGCPPTMPLLCRSGRGPCLCDPDNDGDAMLCNPF